MEGPRRHPGYSDKRYTTFIDESHGCIGERKNCSRLNILLYGKDINEDKPAKQTKGLTFVKDAEDNGYADSKGGTSPIVDFPQQSEGDVNVKVAFDSCKAGNQKIVDFPQQKQGQIFKDKQGDGKISIEYAFIGSLFGDNDELRLGPSQPSVVEPTQQDDELDDDKEEDKILNDERDVNQEKEPEGIKHARELVSHAEALYESLSSSIKTANERLKSLNNQRAGVPDVFIEDLRTTLVDRVKLVYGTIETREMAIKDLEEKDEEQQITIVELQQELVEAHNAQKMGLSDHIKNQLNNLGFKDVQEIIYKYIFLQDRVQVLERTRKGSTLSRASSKVSLQAGCQQSMMMNQTLPGQLTSLLSNGVNVVPQSRVTLPMPEKFTGKTRSELERFFKLYEASTASRGWGDSERALYLGSYLPKLQVYHDNLSKRGADYTEMKKELLAALGSDGAISTFYLRTELDRIKKAPNKLYKSVFEEIELRVAQAFGNDVEARENELKKILLRLTEEDSDQIFKTIVLTNVAASYYQLKELVLGLESSQVLKHKPEKAEVKPSNSFRKPFFPNRQDNHASGGGYQYRSANHTNAGAEVKPQPRSYPQPNTNYQQNGPGSNRYPFTKHCYNCNKDGHLARDCTENKTVNTNVVDIEDMMLNVSGIMEINNVSEDTVGREPMFGKQA
uniref:CCHC-type domain-containing protein n=1 Tax=Panagrolaimus sp. PS1159 TaxID=55785 RepID=A0AC35G030_9BILA